MSSIIIPKHESFPKKNYSKANDSHPISSINTNISEVAKNKQENITRFSPSLNNTECNDLTMRKVIMQNIHSNPSTAKRQIQLAMRKKFSGFIDTICSTKPFNYLINSDLYCEVQQHNITCLVFRQAFR
ncbi:Uncharacterized protein BM_BM14692 [Brugia malayi]|uniref:Ground-like domain-containing protein n=2 Tax=Brugia TaxID=6278 RepID=A0A4E9FKG5_BRUMA|nr:Uncharacterized protein BM_BM14692 [Brugia malayi]VIO97501.1 Uncharacterized protein BM_BM14692 [Brugia malayi]